MDKKKSYQYIAQYNMPIERVWNCLVDTSRIDEIYGVRPYVPVEKLLGDNSIIRSCETKIKGMLWRWQERFCEWTYLSEVRMAREMELPSYFDGIIEAKFIQKDNLCKTEIVMTWVAKSFFAKILYFLGFFKIMSYTINVAIESYIKSKNKHSPIDSNWKPPTYSKKVIQRVEQLIKKIDESKYGHQLGKKIADYVMYSLSNDVGQVRPLSIAKEWNSPPVEVVEAFMQSVNIGLLGMRWDLLCPLCRMPKSPRAGLHELPKGAHCFSCNINFDLNFDKNVELVFFPAPWLRYADEKKLCLLSATNTPHIMAQWRLMPGESRKINIPNYSKKYRFRSLETQKTLDFELENNQNYPNVLFTDSGFVLLSNNTSLARYIVVEKIDYYEDILTGQKLLAMKAFRELFPEQLLKPGDEVGITNLTVMFTDLKNSTEFYSKTGDASAYKVVREHFGFLSNIIYKQQGTIVKTIGDSVMAVFNNPIDAVHVSLNIQNKLKEFNLENNSSLKIKIGIHQGSCIAVNLNNIMDYFGTTINLAARLHELSDGNDFVTSDVFFENVLVNEALVKYPYTKEIKNVKGLSHPITLYRIKP